MDTKSTVEIMKRRTNTVFAKVDAAKLTHFSIYGRQQLARAAPPGTPAKSISLPYTQVQDDDEEKALGKVLQWIDSNDINNPKPLTGDAVEIEEFPEFVYVYRAAYMLHIDRTLRGNAIRDEIVSYIRSAPLRFDEFAMVLEVCNFDTSLGYVVKNNTMLFKSKGGVPEMAKIEEYAKQCGFWDEIVAIEKAVAGSAKK